MLSGIWGFGQLKHYCYNYIYIIYILILYKVAHVIFKVKFPSVQSVRVLNKEILTRSFILENYLIVLQRVTVESASSTE